MNTSPLFSIIMPTRNRADLIPFGIESIIDQTWKNWELIIVDDGSTDDTKDVVESYTKDNRIKYFYQEHQERSTARNQGINLAKGEYICFIDDDDYLSPKHLQVFQKNIFLEEKKPPILRVGYLREKEKKRESTHLYDPNGSLNPAHYAALNFCGVWSLAIPREYLREHQFPLDYRHWQDTHLIIRLLALFPFKQINEFTYIYRIHSAMGSFQAYYEPDARARIQSNVEAMHHLFKTYPEIVNTVLPTEMHDFLVCQKYSDHAHGALVAGNLPLAWDLFRKSFHNNSGGWFYWLYFKFILKIPLKWLTGYPKLS